MASAALVAAGRAGKLVTGLADGSTPGRSAWPPGLAGTGSAGDL